MPLGTFDSVFCKGKCRPKADPLEQLPSLSISHSLGLVDDTSSSSHMLSLC